MESTWKSLKTTVSEELEKHVGRKKKNRKDWVSQKSVSLADKAPAARLAKDLSYKQLRRETTKSLKMDKNNYWSKIATETEQAAANGDTHRLYQLIKQAARGNTPCDSSLLDSEGNPIQTAEKRIKRWNEHFSVLLKHDPP